MIKDIVTKPQKKTQLILPTPSELWKPSLHPEISSAKPFNSRRIYSQQHGHNAACTHHSCSDLDASSALAALPSPLTPRSSPPGRVTAPSPSQTNAAGRSRGGEETQRLQLSICARAAGSRKANGFPALSWGGRGSEPPLGGSRQLRRGSGSQKPLAMLHCPLATNPAADGGEEACSVLPAWCCRAPLSPAGW